MNEFRLPSIGFSVYRHYKEFEIRPHKLGIRKKNILRQYPLPKTVLES